MMLSPLVLVLAAQTLTVTVKPNTPIPITWDSPVESPMPNFRAWCDGAIVKNYATADLIKAPTPNADGTVSYTAVLPGLAAGTHSCFVSAVNDVGESKSDAIPIVVGTAPGTPIKLRIVVTVGGG